MRDFITKIANSKVFKVFWLVYAVFSVLLVLYLGDGLLTIGYKDMQVTVLNDNWDIIINDEEYNNVSLDEFTFDTVTIDDTIEMTTTLPKDWEYADPVMCFHIRQATIDLLVDDEIVYQYGYDRREEGKTVGSGLLFINMFEEYKGKELKIKLTVSEKSAFSRFDEIWISEWNDSYRLVITNNRLPMFLGFFFVIFGVVGAAISSIAVLTSRKYWGILCLSGFSVFMGLWTLCYYNCAIVFSLPVYSITLLEYMALFIAPLPIIGYMHSYVKSIQNKKYTVAFWILFICQYIITSTLITLHTLDIVHAAATLLIFQVTIVVHLVFFSRVLLKTMKKQRKLNSSSLWAFVGPILVITFIGYDLIEYLTRRYMGMELPSIKGLSSLGVFIFIIILFIDLLYSVTDNMMEEQEKALFIKRAYTDDMTLMNNRRFCSEYMNELENEETEYTIISFDLNGLKTINDVYGHTKGDILIKKAADVITDAFGKYGIVGRMGGDEFISILKTVDQDEIKKIIDRFNELIANANKKDEELELSISLGYASSIEIENCDNVEKIYHLADNRMYENKKHIKEGSDSVI